MIGPQASPATPHDDWLVEANPLTRRLLEAALAEFSHAGYHGTSTRSIAARAGMSAAAVYLRFPTKERLLRRIILDGHAAIGATVRRAEQSEAEPRRRLHAMTEVFVVWHATHAAVARVAQYELEALAADSRAEVAAQRHAIEETFARSIASTGRPAAWFSDVQMLTRAVLSMCIDVARWSPSHPEQDWSELGRVYGAVAVRMAEARRTC